MTNKDMAKNLVVVESPAKAKTIGKILGRNYKVLASYGHVRDLPKSKLGVDVEKNFEPQYVIPTKSRKNLTALKEAFKDADMMWLATDEDREGEAIAWHIQQGLKIPDEKVKRVAFHEITETAVKKAFENPRGLNMNMVNAQQARRVLDRLVGYKLSPLLWKKIFRGLSAGRVQSAALRLIVEREREIKAFKPEEYWEIDLSLAGEKGEKLTTRVINENGKKAELRNQADADRIVEKIQAADKHIVSGIKKGERKRSPSPPFTTSTLQQAAGTNLGYSVKKTMTVAQQLYEGIDVGFGSAGLI
ncbi:type I DNA topoisomerase, partial [candidate division Kazan bacterium]